MKTKLLILSICMGLLSMGATAKIKDGEAMTGNSLTSFGKYTIMNSTSPMVANNQVLNTYELTYENLNNPVYIGVVKEKKCKTFVVRSSDFEIEYTCDRGVFGVKIIESKYQTLPTAELKSKLDKVSYFSQRVISQKNKSEDEILGLIACYFPNLIKEEYHAGM